MIKKTLALILVISITYIPSLSQAEEPFIGVGIVNHQVKEDSGDINDFDVKPSSYRFTVGSRIAKNWIVEAYYLKSADSDDITIGGDPITFDIEYESVFGTSINIAYVDGPFTFYAGPNLSIAKLKGEVDTKASSGTLSASDISVLNKNADYDSRISIGAGAGIDLNLYKNFSLDLNVQTYLIDGDQTGYGYGAELRYHL